MPTVYITKEKYDRLLRPSEERSKVIDRLLGEHLAELEKKSKAK